MFGIIILLFSLGTIFWLSRNVVLFGTKAALSNTPKDIQVTNITDKSFTVSYITDEAVNGTLNFGLGGELENVAFDTRDNSSPKPHRIHYINVENLTPATKYLFSLASGDGVFQNDSKPFETTTAKPIQTASASPQTTTLPAGRQVTGKVTIDGNSAPEEAIVYIKSKDSQTVSSLLKADGGFEVKLTNILKNDLSGAAEIGPDTKLSMRIVDAKLTSTVSFLASLANQVPPVILSKDYDFTLGDASLATASESAEVTGFPESTAGQSTSFTPVILTPKTDEKFSDQQPLFIGKAPPGADVEITIESDPITITVQADTSGAWQFRPDTKLTPGVHKITIKALNAQGILETITRQFTVLAQGSQFTEPSISPSPTSSPSATPTAVPSVTRAVSPTPTPTLTPTPTAVATPTRILTPTPTTQITIPTIPPSGSTALTIGLTGISILIGIGSLLFFLL